MREGGKGRGTEKRVSQTSHYFFFPSLSSSVLHFPPFLFSSPFFLSPSSSFSLDTYWPWLRTGGVAAPACDLRPSNEAAAVARWANPVWQKKKGGEPRGNGCVREGRCYLEENMDAETRPSPLHKQQSRCAAVT